MAERVLTQRELNRALLARQFLLERARLTIPRLLERIGGLQTQYAPSAYVGIWSRLEDFERDALTRALERRTVIQGTLMRVTIHMVSRQDYWPIALGIREGRRRWSRRVHRNDEGDQVRAAERIRTFLSAGPRRESEIVDELGRETWRPGVTLWVDLVRVPPSGTWDRRRADLLGLAEDWVGPAQVTEQEGLEHVVRRYLGGFGPAPRADIADWAGLKITALEPTLERMELRRFRDEQGKELLDLPRAPLPDPCTPAAVRFLPVWDATLLVHARRTQILPERYRPLIFNARNPQSTSTFLVDGAVAGTWRYDEGRIELEPFERLSRLVRRELDDEGEHLAALYS